MSNIFRSMKLLRQQRISNSFSLHFKPFRFQSRGLHILPNSSPKRHPFLRKRVILLGSLATLATFSYLTNEQVHSSANHVILLIKRVSVVTKATSKCLYNYKKTLNKKYSTTEDRSLAISDCHLKCAKITLKALEKNGGIYIKFGQHISAMTYVLPKEWTETMLPLLDKCPESTYKEISDMFERDLNLSISDIFSEFDPKPIGVASLAQVHIGKLLDTNEKVAIKCQHPSLKEFIPLDIMLTQTVFNILEVVFPDYSLTYIGDELQQSIYVETDFINEARNAKLTISNFKPYYKKTALKIPKIVQAHKRILIMEYLNGAKLDDLKYLDKHNISRDEVSICLTHIFNKMIFTPNWGIHCDPHIGNLSIQAIEKVSNGGHNFEIILYDHGLYRYPTLDIRRNYAHFWLAILYHNINDMKKYSKIFANIDEEQFPLFTAAVTGRSIDTVLNKNLIQNSIRTQDEIVEMTNGIMEGENLSHLMNILSKVPRIVLLILKTNDLTRHLDEVLKCPVGIERNFLIMAQYCLKIVYNEEIEIIDNNFQRSQYKRYFKKFKCWCNYEWKSNLLFLYDSYIVLQRFISAHSFRIRFRLKTANI